MLLGALPLLALPIGNPAAPAILEQGFFIPDNYWTSFQCGYIGDILNQKRFHSYFSSRNKTIFSGFSQSGFVAWNIRERFNIQIEFGSGQYRWYWEEPQSIAITGQVSSGLLWSGSAKLVIFEIKDTSLAIDGHAGGWDWMDGHANMNGVPLTTVDSWMRYWQIGAAFSQKIGFLDPYAGVAINRTKVKIIDNVLLRSRQVAGPFLGCTLSSGTLIFLNIEWRGGFEQGFSLSSQIRF